MTINLYLNPLLSTSSTVLSVNTADYGNSPTIPLFMANPLFIMELFSPARQPASPHIIQVLLPTSSNSLNSLSAVTIH